MIRYWIHEVFEFVGSLIAVVGLIIMCIGVKLADVWL